MRVAIVGATGAVGEALVSILEERDFPVSELRCFSRLRGVPEWTMRPPAIPAPGPKSIT